MSIKTGYIIIPTQFGFTGIVWSKPKLLCRVFLPTSRQYIEQQIELFFPEARPDCTDTMAEIRSRLVKYFQGEKVRFHVDKLDRSQLYSFQYRVLKVERTISYGKVSTYSALAQEIRNPGAARAVGTALARNPFPIIIPCHRTVRMDGSLGGFQGGTQLKRQLLEFEGVTFTKQGRVDPDCFV